MVVPLAVHWHTLARWPHARTDIRKLYCFSKDFFAKDVFFSPISITTLKLVRNFASPR
jgi:hypothetical protein